jgi:hypothetical protein
MSFQLMNFQSQNFEVVDWPFAGACRAGEWRIHESLLESWLTHLVLPASDAFAIVTEKKKEIVIIMATIKSWKIKIYNNHASSTIVHNSTLFMVSLTLWN